jgi:hypothetical protein
VKETAVNEQAGWDIEGDGAPPGTVADEETLVVDPRGEMTAAQFVERKLLALLRGGSLPVSIHTRRCTGR